MMNGLTTKEWEACSAQGADEDGSGGILGGVFLEGGTRTGTAWKLAQRR